MRRVLAAVFGTAVGTMLLIALKTGPSTGKAATPVAATAAPLAPAPSGLVVPTPQAAVPAAPTAPRGPSGSRAPAGSRGPASTPRPTAAPPAPAGATGTFTGPVAQTEYGPVQVRVVMAGGRMTDVTAVQLPKSSSRSTQLSGRAAPILRQEALSAQSASIDTVSGATFTSEGYRSSLQAALDAARRR